MADFDFIAEGLHNMATFRIEPMIYIGDENRKYEKIMIGQFDFIALVRQIEALRNEVDYLKETLVDVLAEQAVKQGEEAMAEERATIAK